MAGTWTTALISGGGSGIGLRLAEVLLREGTRVALIDLAFSDAALTRLAAAGGDRVATHVADVRDGDALAAVIARAAGELGHVALAVNSAGVGHGARFADITEAEFRRVIDINLVGSRNFAAGVLPHMTRGNHLALIASLAGVVPNYGYGAYGTSKFGALGLASILRLEYRPLGVTVSAVCPPEIDTPLIIEERKTAPPETARLKALVGTLTVDQAVDGILAGLRARRFMVIPGFRARATYQTAGIAPWLLRAVCDQVVAWSLKRGK